MLLEYLTTHYNEGEPIFLQDIIVKNMSAVSIRHGMKKLVDEKKIERYEQGIYFIPKKSILKGNKTLAPDIVARYKYINRCGNTMGYYAGHTLANKLGLTAQVPQKIEIVSNNMAAIVREIIIGNRPYIVRRPTVKVDSSNYTVLQLLEILKNFDDYCDDEELGRNIITTYIKDNNIKRTDVEKYIDSFPLSVYKQIFKLKLEPVFA